MTFCEYSFLGSLIAAGGSQSYRDAIHFSGLSRQSISRIVTKMRGLGMVASHRFRPYTITERGRIAHAIEAGCYIKRRHARRRAA